MSVHNLWKVTHPRRLSGATECSHCNCANVLSSPEEEEEEASLSARIRTFSFFFDSFSLFPLFLGGLRHATCAAPHVTPGYQFQKER